MDTNTSEPIVDALKALGTLANEVIDISGVDHLVIPENYRVHSFEKLLGRPIHLKQDVEAKTIESFIEYFNRYSDENSTIFIDIENAKFLAVIDYHEAVNEESLTGNLPRHNTHKLTYICPITPEWKQWKTNDRKGMTQEAFANFIEEMAPEIIYPSSMDMLEIAKSMHVKNNLEFKKSIRLDNGQTQLQYREVIDGAAGADGSMTIPTEIKIAVQFYLGGKAYEMAARFKYRLQNAQLLVSYELIRPHNIIDAANKALIEIVDEKKARGHIYQGIPTL